MPIINLPRAINNDILQIKNRQLCLEVLPCQSENTINIWKLLASCSIISAPICVEQPAEREQAFASGKRGF